MHRTSPSGALLAVALIGCFVPGSPWLLSSPHLRPLRPPSSPRASHAERLCCCAAGDGSTLEAAESVLDSFDREHQRVAREGFRGEREGFGGGTSATKWAASHPNWPALRRAVLALSSQSEKVMLGICADDASEGVAALKQWVGALELPKGRLHGMDRDGQALDMTDFGAVFIKYSSVGGQVSSSGDAMLNGYAGSFRGVYFNPQLADGEFRQYAVLPLFLFDKCGAPVEDDRVARESTVQQDGSAKTQPHASNPTAHCSLTKESVGVLIAPLSDTLVQLGASLSVMAVDDASASVCLDFKGPDVLNFGITNALQQGGVTKVVFHPETLQDRAKSHIFEFDGVDD